MTLNANQFSQSPVKGMLSLLLNPNTIAAQVDPAADTALVHAQAVKIVDSSSGVPQVQACTDDADDVFGFVNFVMKQSSFAAGKVLELSQGRGNVMYMEASEAIAKGAQVMIVVSGQKVATATSGKTIVGKALDKADAEGDLIRVEIDLGAKKVSAD